MKNLGLSVVSLALACSCFATEPKNSFAINKSAQVGLPSVFGGKIRVGYTYGNSFTLNDNSSKRLSGPEIGLEIPFRTMGPLSISFAPSVLLGGQLSKGSDLDGYVYRTMILARTNAAVASAFYGVGYVYQSPRGGAAFDKKGGYEIQIGGAAPLVGGGLELTYHITNVNAAKGYTLSYLLKF